MEFHSNKKSSILSVNSNKSLFSSTETDAKTQTYVLKEHIAESNFSWKCCELDTTKHYVILLKRRCPYLIIHHHVCSAVRGKLPNRLYKSINVFMTHFFSGPTPLRDLNVCLMITCQPTSKWHRGSGMHGNCVEAWNYSDSKIPTAYQFCTPILPSDQREIEWDRHRREREREGLVLLVSDMNSTIIISWFYSIISWLQHKT